MTIGLMFLSLAVLLIGSGVSAFTNGNGKWPSRIGVVTTVTGALPAFVAGGSVLWTGVESSIRLPWRIPFASFYIAVDPLSAFFIVTISLISGLAAVYGLSYLDHDRGKKNLGVSWCFFNLLFASMLLVAISRNGILFLVAWEAMSLTSFFLVMFEHEKPEVREAGWVYLIAAHVGQACLMLLFILMASPSASLDFDNLITSAGAPAGILFLLATVGFGTKAGFVPLHVWLPDAHPAAPSHVSAVMSGVMIKMGIYGLVRIVSMLGAPAEWWGWTLLLIGVVSGVMGVLLALAQHDIKRLLAYHSVENIGIISMGLGLWLIGVSLGRPVLAVLGLMGGLLHVLNHALFKSLLFFGAGAVVHATGTRNMDLLGGLMKRMPQTALAFGIGAAAICGLPPLNGFVSEFLIYLGIFRTAAEANAPEGALAAVLIALAALALIGGLAAACFAKVFGIVFLGEPRRGNLADVHEVPGSMRAAMAIPAALCIFLGLAGPIPLMLATPVAGQLLGNGPAEGISVKASMLLGKVGLVGGILIVLTGIFWAGRNRLLAGRENLRGSTWDCGYAAPNSRMQYTASSFALPVIDMFRWVVRPKIHAEIGKGFFPQEAALSSHTDDIFRQGLFAPVLKWTSVLAQRIHVLQEGRNQLYVLYIAITILILLLVKVR